MELVSANSEARGKESSLTFVIDSFFYEALLIPFEISAFTLVLSYWSPTVTEAGPTAGIIIGVICIYAYVSTTCGRK